MTTTKKATLESFMDLPDHPIQRNTIHHAKKAIGGRGHLREACPTHAHVSSVTLGKMTYKVDGHTRSYLWSKELLEQPAHLMVTNYKVKDERELHELYRHFDNSGATEIANDKIEGTMRYHKIKIAQPSFLRMSGCSTGLQFATGIASGSLSRHTARQFEMVDLIGEWKTELKWLFGPSEIQYSVNRKDMMRCGWSGCMTMAALLTLRVHKNAAMSFWEACSCGEGQKTKNGMDGVEVFTRYMIRNRMEGNLTTQHLLKHVYMALQCFDLWMGNHFVSGTESLFKSVGGIGRARFAGLIFDWMVDHGHKELKTLGQIEMEIA